MPSLTSTLAIMSRTRFSTVHKIELSFGIHLGDHAHPLIRLQTEPHGVLAVEPDFVLRLKGDVAPVIGDGAGLAAEGLFKGEQPEGIAVLVHQRLASSVASRLVPREGR